MLLLERNREAFGGDLFCIEPLTRHLRKMVQYWLVKQGLFFPLLARRKFARQPLVLCLSFGFGGSEIRAAGPVRTVNLALPSAQVQQVLADGHRLSSEGRLQEACQLA